MALFYLQFDKSFYIILITSVLWTINYRSTFKNNSDSMGLGSCWVLRFDPMPLLIKNIICIFYLIVYFYEIKLSKSDVNRKIFIQKKEKNQIVIQKEELDHIIMVERGNNLLRSKNKIFFWIRIILLILVVYIIEELYFILSNSHTVERVICSIRNFCLLLGLFIFSPLILKKPCSYNKHHLIPSIMLFVFSLLILLFNIFAVERFFKKFQPVNSSIYYSEFFLMGLEIVIVKHLMDKEFISMYLILGIKGIIGTIIFTIINIAFTKRQFYDLLDSILTFEYDDMLDDFEIIFIIIYIITFVILEWIKIYIINQYGEYHFPMVLMMVDLIYFPFYCIERFAIQKFSVFNIGLLLLNTIVCFINIFFMLIFNEILECNFWGLNKDLKKNINIRKDIETKENIDIYAEGNDDEIELTESFNNDE